MSKEDRILVGVDGSESALRAVKFAAQMAKSRGGRLTLYNIIAPSEYQLFSAKMTRPLEEETMGDERLHKAVKVAKEYGVEYDSKVEFGNPAQLLLEESERGYSALVVGHRGLGAFQELVMGSVSSKLVHLCKIPTVVVP